MADSTRVRPLGALVTTTIGSGQFLDAYVDNFHRCGELEQVTIIVIPDRKTPPALFEQCHRLTERGAQVICPSLSEQEAYLAKLQLDRLILYDSDHRRNVGFLMALDNGCDFLISIDDDNICRPDSHFLAEHAVVCRGETAFETVDSTTGWFNICDLMDVQPETVYPRGFPYRFRRQDPTLRCRPDTGQIHLNGGLWLGEPDLDGITWLANPARAVSFGGRSIVLGSKTWSPINTQNTALHRGAIAAFYFLRMGYRIAGMRIDRYGDIFSGYFCQACVRRLGYRVRIGTPVVDHIRNKHDYLRDLTNELGCIWVLEDMAEWLRSYELQGSTYVETYLCLADALEDATEKFRGFIWDDATRAYFHQVAYDMRIWIKAVRSITG